MRGRSLSLTRNVHNKSAIGDERSKFIHRNVRLRYELSSPVYIVEHFNSAIDSEFRLLEA